MATDGVCAIKEEFVIKDRTRSLQVENDAKESLVQENEDVESVPPIKKYKPSEDTLTNSEAPKSKHPKQKARGQNKGRPKPIREAMEVRPCPSIVNVPEGQSPKPCNHHGCKYMHDPIEFLKIKPKDISINDGICYMFELKGECPRGLSCRYGYKHISPTGHNIINNEKLSKWSNSISNTLSFEVLMKLQKKKYDTSLAETLVNSKKKDRDAQQAEQKNKNLNNAVIIQDVKESSNIDIVVESMTPHNQEKFTSGAVTDEDRINLRDVERKKIDWKNKLYLSPLTTLGNLPYRRICKEYGADITCGEMALCDSLLKGTKQEWALVKRHKSEDLFGVQICGSNPYAIAKTADLLQKEIVVDFIDLNLGCPIDLVYKKGGGCGMLLRTSTLETSIKCASEILSVPFTIKTRTGVYQETKIAHQLVPKFSQWGVSMMTIHGRSREQRYTKFADWDYINQCALAASPCPVFGNGDIMSFDDYVQSRKTAPNVTGVMIGRGALIKPWIFSEIKEQKLWDIRSSERFDILKKFTNYGLEHWGSDTQGVENTRRFLLEWLSFLHRYVPVGILERPPQRINERPPCYHGRDDLETMMASSNCADWIKISEMLVGPVPNGFQFLPKHKANSYN